MGRLARLCRHGAGGLLRRRRQEWCGRSDGTGRPPGTAARRRRGAGQLGEPDQVDDRQRQRAGRRQARHRGPTRKRSGSAAQRPCRGEHQLRAGAARTRSQRQLEPLARHHAPHGSVPRHAGAGAGQRGHGHGPDQPGHHRAGHARQVGRGQPGQRHLPVHVRAEPAGHQRHSLRRVAGPPRRPRDPPASCRRDRVHPGQQRRLHLDAGDGRCGRVGPRDRRQRHLQRLPRPARVPRRRALRPAVLRDVPRAVLVRRADRQHDRPQGDDPQDPPRHPADRSVRDLRLRQHLLRLLADPVHAGPAQLPDLPPGERHRHAAGQQLAPDGEPRGLRLVPQRRELRHRRRPRRRRGDRRPVHGLPRPDIRTSACGRTTCTSTRCCGRARRSSTKC